MGHVRVKIRIANPTRRQEFVDVDDALVDTGATWTTVTRDIADRLGLQVVDQVQADTAAGEVKWITHLHSFKTMASKASPTSS
ncbi:MAG: hypothetical protein E6I03_12740 [Chloroflexi bacterium]|nr:MAG: hypothetical protein E6I03_12740 [Chloroflexota bacterium]